MGSRSGGVLLAGGGLSLGYNDRDQTTTVNTDPVAYGDAGQGERLSYGALRFANTITGLTSYTEATTETSVVREPTGQFTGLRRALGADRRHPLTDGLGSVIGLTDATGAQTDSYRYGPYGQTTKVTGTTPNPFRFTGEHQDPSGAYEIGARYYRPLQLHRPHRPNLRMFGSLWRGCTCAASRSCRWSAPACRWRLRLHRPQGARPRKVRASRFWIDFTSAGP